MAKRGKTTLPSSQPRTTRGVTKTDVLVGQRLRQRRMEIGMSQQELGSALGISFQQIQKYEKGVNRLGISRIQQIIGILGTSMDYFIGDMNGQKPVEPSELSAFISTKDGIQILEAMMKLSEPHRRAIIAMARTLGEAYAP